MDDGILPIRPKTREKSFVMLYISNLVSGEVRFICETDILINDLTNFDTIFKVGACEIKFLEETNEIYADKVTSIFIFLT